MKNNSINLSLEIVKKSLLPFFTMLIFVASYIFYKFKISPVISSSLRQELKKYIGTIFIVCIIFIIQRIIGAVASWCEKDIAAQTKTRLDDDIVPLLRGSLNIIVWVIGFLVILPLYGVNINALIAALGVGSLAIALAAQDTIANIIAGFLIMIDRPFRIDDKIKLPSGEIVKVLDIGIRRSKFLFEDNAIIIVPNLDLSKSKIVKYTYGEER